jgi:cytochrome c556
MAQLMRFRFVIVLALTAAAAAMTGALLAAQAGPPVAAAPVPRPILDNGEMMDIFFKPAYTELQEAMAKPPADRRAWATIYQKAVRLAEIENLLFFRAKNDDTVRPEWADSAAKAREAAADLAAAALLGLRNVRPEDYDAVRAKYPAVADTCNACHRTFAREAPTVKP